MNETAEFPKVIRKKIITVKPYLDEKSENMGLSKYGEVLFPGTSYNEQLTCLEADGVKRYLNGLDEFAPEVQKIKDPEKKEATIKKIRQNVIFLERAFESNDTLNIDDKDFWSNVVRVHPKNSIYWDNIFMTISNEPCFLDPENPNDFVKICCIEAGGFSAIAASFEDAQRSPKAPKFYLDRDIETTSTKVELKKLKNLALSNLQTLTKNTKKLLYVGKIINPNSHQFNYSTSSDVIYNYIDDYVTGLAHEKSAKKASEKFNKAFAMDIEDLKIKAVIVDAVFYKLIEKHADGMQYHRATKSMLGRNMEEILTYYKDAMNANLWETQLSEVEKYWNS